MQSILAAQLAQAGEELFVDLFGRHFYFDLLGPFQSDGTGFIVATKFKLIDDVSTEDGRQPV